MRVAILGAGVIGVTTAYELALDDPSHDICVYDVGAEAASEASAVNASMIAPGHSYAWASPKVPLILLKSFYRNDQAFRIRLRFDRKFWQWTALFLKQCNDQDAKDNTRRKHALCAYSQQRLGEIVDFHQIDYDRVTRGLLYLYRNRKSFETGCARSDLLTSLGQQIEVLSANQVAQLDSAYEGAVPKLAGALYSPTDETGSCKRFTEALVRLCESRGVQFQFDCKIQSLRRQGGQIAGVETTNGEIDADLYIICLGAHTPLLLKPVGIDLPIYPVKGYSVTFPTRQSNNPPAIGAIDEDNLVAIAPVGEMMRVTATAEFSGYDLSHSPKHFNPMMSAARNLLPDAADYGRPNYRACFRPMTPQGTPFIGFTRLENLFINCGQGHMGWTMACGSARIAADLIAGKPGAIDTAAFSPN